MVERNGVLITGGGSGLGEAMARTFSRNGWKVAVTDIDLDRALSVADDLDGEGHLAFRLDVTCDEDWRQAERNVTHEWGALDVLVNNAGIARGGSTEATDFADWDQVLAINLLGVVRGCRQFIPVMRRFRSGHIVNVASWAGLAGAPNIAAYGTAKAAVVALSEMLRAELYPHGINVSVACPAFVRTRLLESFRSPDPGDARRVERWMERSPVSAGDVAEQIYRAVRRRRFMILTHADTRRYWRLKRWFPELYFRLLMRRTTQTRQKP